MSGRLPRHHLCTHRDESKAAYLFYLSMDLLHEHKRTSDASKAYSFFLRAGSVGTNLSF